MAVLEIITAPEQVLMEAGLAVDEVDSNIRQMMSDMLETMYKHQGVGLAANQVGILKRVLVIDLQNDDDVQRNSDFYPLFVANPVITISSEEMVEAEEGCLSLPEQKIAVVRPYRVNVEYIDYHNEKKELLAEGWLARVLQHEIDHLDGKLLVNYLSPLKQSMVLRKLKKIKKFLD